MNGTIQQRLQGAAGAGLAVLMALALIILREEVTVMGLTIIIVILMLGLVMPLFWIVGTVGSITYFFLNRRGAARKEQTLFLNPQLGLTMADGGDPIDEEKKDFADCGYISLTEGGQGTPGKAGQKSVRGKLFWWGGYY